jgi:hypothetical protein
LASQDPESESREHEQISEQASQNGGAWVDSERFWLARRLFLTVGDEEVSKAELSKLQKAAWFDGLFIYAKQ